MSSPSPAPVFFLGHGSPMNIIAQNDFTESLRALGASREKPPAAMVISAHWMTRGRTLVSTCAQPETIHDFGGFPPELYRIRYPAPGALDWAERVAASVTIPRMGSDPKQGLDHGAWSVLHHLWPGADVPVFQLSVDMAAPPRAHFELGRTLRPWREEGLWIMGSGNIVHNLREMEWEENAPPPAWALEFDVWAGDRLEKGDADALISYERHPAGRRAVPTPDHYFPMLLTLGLLDPGETIRFTCKAMQNATISMRSFTSSP